MPSCGSLVASIWLSKSLPLAAQTGLIADFYPDNPTIDNSLYR
jgi:hypothetical protein